MEPLHEPPRAAAGGAWRDCANLPWVHGAGSCKCGVESLSGTFTVAMHACVWLIGFEGVGALV